MKRAKKQSIKKKKEVKSTEADTILHAREALLEAREQVVSRSGRLPREMIDLTRQLGPLFEHILLPQRLALQIADEVAERLKRKKPEKKVARTKFENPLFLDTSAIIDERLFELVKLGVFYGNFVIIEGVLSELKHIADIKDDVKKERGRRGLKMLEELKKLKNIKLNILPDDEKTAAVDDKIIHFAKKNRGRIITCDFNLSKKAKISGVTAIDLHEVANALKTQAIPGDSFFVKVIQAGKGEGQGVGYLPDGTMIVIENGVLLIGKTIKVEVSRIIQTEAGKILFSKIVSD